MWATASRLTHLTVWPGDTTIRCGRKRLWRMSTSTTAAVAVGVLAGFVVASSPHPASKRQRGSSQARAHREGLRAGNAI